MSLTLSFHLSPLAQEPFGPDLEGPRPDGEPSSAPPVGVRRRELTPRDPSPAPHHRVAEDQPEEQRLAAPSRRPFPPAPHHMGGQSHAGSAVLIVVLTLALATLIFRRIYLAQDYKFDYDL